MPRQPGAINYNNELLLINIIEEQKPKGATGWQNVAILYKNRSNDAIQRDPEDIKRQWIEKLCNKMKKPTGNTGQEAKNRIFRCQQIQLAILRSVDAAMLGGGEESDSGGEDSDDEDEDSEEDDEFKCHQRSHSNCNNQHNSSAASLFWSSAAVVATTNAAATPPPTTTSPCSSPRRCKFASSIIYEKEKRQEQNKEFKFR